ncbi:MAG: hypothetical protein FJZ01_13015 [Candidatus Sericytochromatia bacterium]|nr:hypothetical protein [Candidatus Tanganyikabacteria bacterium]
MFNWRRRTWRPSGKRMNPATLDTVVSYVPELVRRRMADPVPLAVTQGERFPTAVLLATP